MKKGLMSLVLILLMATYSLAEGVRNMTSAEVKQLMAGKRSVFLLDVRTPREYRQGRLQGAVTIPLGELEKRVGEVPRNRTVVVYCAVGGRSADAAEILAQKGFTDIVNMSDGIMGWFRNGFPVER